MKILKEAYENKNIMYINMNLYISGVDIHPDYQVIVYRHQLYHMKSLKKKKGYEMLYISNAY